MNEKYTLDTIDALIKIINNEKNKKKNIRSKLESEKGINKKIKDSQSELEIETEKYKQMLENAISENLYLQDKLEKDKTILEKKDKVENMFSGKQIYLKDVNLDYLSSLGTDFSYGYGYGYGSGSIDFDKNPYFVSLNEEAKQKYYYYLFNQIANLKKDVRMMLANNLNNLEIVNMDTENIYPNIIISAPPATGKTTYLINNNDSEIVDMDWLYLTIMKELSVQLNMNIYSSKIYDAVVSEYKNLAYSLAEKIIDEYIYNNNYHKVIMGTFIFSRMKNLIMNKVHIVFFIPDKDVHYSFAKKRGDVSDQQFNYMRNQYEAFEKKWSTSPYFHKVDNLKDAITVAKMLNTRTSITQLCNTMKKEIDPALIYIVNKNLKNRLVEKNKISTIHSMEYVYDNIGSFINIKIQNNIPTIKLVINDKLILSDNCRLISKVNDFHIIQLSWYRNEILKMYNTLCKTRKVPDINIIQNIGDFPVLRNDNLHPFTYRYPGKILNKGNDINVFSYSVSNDYNDIMVPTPDVIKFIHDMEPYKNKNYNHDWDSKIPKAIFRGSVTTCVGNDNPRILSHLLSLEYPDYLDSRLVGFMDYPLLLNNDDKTSNFISIENLPELGDKSKFMSMKDQLNYKYILHIDGFVSAWRLIYFLFSKSVILKVDSEWKEYFYDLLQPWVHYIPIKKDLSDLVQIIDWCRNNDNICKQIAENAHTFATKYLNEKSVYDYMQLLLFEYYNPIETPIASPKYTPLVDPNTISLNPLPPKATNVNVAIKTKQLKLNEGGILEGGGEKVKYNNIMIGNAIHSNYNRDYVNVLNK